MVSLEFKLWKGIKPSKTLSHLFSWALILYSKCDNFFLESNSYVCVWNKWEYTLPYIVFLTKQYILEIFPCQKDRSNSFFLKDTLIIGIYSNEGFDHFAIDRYLSCIFFVLLLLVYKWCSSEFHCAYILAYLWVNS